MQTDVMSPFICNSTVGRTFIPLSDMSQNNLKQIVENMVLDMIVTTVIGCQAARILEARIHYWGKDSCHFLGLSSPVTTKTPDRPCNDRTAG